jgi:hypothetical protein
MNFFQNTDTFSNKTFHSLAMQTLSNDKYGSHLWIPPSAWLHTILLAISHREAYTDFSDRICVSVAQQLFALHHNNQDNYITKHHTIHNNKLYRRPSGYLIRPTHL